MARLRQVLVRLLCLSVAHATMTTCLPQDARLKRPLLQQMLHSVRTSNTGSLRLAKAGWGTHIVMTEIFRIIVAEFLGHAVIEVPVSGTTGTYRKLANGELDVNVELWQSVAPAEYVESMIQGQAGDGGPHMYSDTARSGVYVRPSTTDMALLLEEARFYSALRTFVLPRLPSTESMLAYCQESSLPDNSQCRDVVNPSCNATCKSIVKEAKSWDAGKIESIIRDAGLPLDIMYTGIGGTENMLEQTSETVLFYWWEPSALIRNNSQVMRMYFDASVACPPAGTTPTSYALYPEDVACDFESGKLHKGFSERMSKVGDALALLYNMQISSLELTDMLVAAKQEGISNEDIACRWVLQNGPTWQSWLRATERLGAEDNTWVLYFFVGTCAIALFWLFMPIGIRLVANPKSKIAKTPGLWCSKTPAEMWHDWSFWVKDLLEIVVLCGRLNQRHDKNEGSGSRIAPSGLDLIAHKSDLSRRSRRTSSAETQEIDDETALQSGVQWSAREAHGFEGQALQLTIIRDERMAKEAVTVRVVALCDGRSTRNGRDFVMNETSIELAAGETYKRFTPLTLIHRTTGSLSYDSGVWQPTRSFELELELSPGAAKQKLGGAKRCAVTILDIDDWPTPGAAKMSRRRVFFWFLYEVVKGNLWNESWWFFGVLVRSFHKYMAVPLLLKILVEQVMDVSDGVNLELGFQLAAIKVFLYLADHYTIYHLSSNFKIAQLTPPTWLLNHWNALPLDVQLDHTVATKYHMMLTRLDGEFGTMTYVTFTRALERAVNVIFALIVTYFLSSQFNVLYLGYAVILTFIFIGMPLLLPRNYAEVNDEFWEHLAEWQRRALDILTEIVSVKYMHTSRRQTIEAMESKAYSKNMQWQKIFVDSTQSEYTSWIMVLPEIALYAMTAILIDLKTFSSGELIAVLTSIRGARSNLIGLSTTKEHWVIAVDMVGDLSDLLCDFKGRISRVAGHGHRRLETISEMGHVPLRLLETLSLRDIDYSSPDLEAFGGADASVCSLSGAVALGSMYGFVFDASNAKQMVRAAVVMDLLGGVRFPTKGVVLTPPYADILVVPREPGLIEMASVLDNLTVGLTADDTIPVDSILALCTALGMSPSGFNKDTMHLPAMQMLSFATGLDKSLMALVRALVHLPHVLLIQDLGELSEKRSEAIQAVLQRFVAGADVEGLSADPADMNLELSLQEGRRRRTVIWGGAKTSAAVMRLLQRLEMVESDSKLRLELTTTARRAPTVAADGARPSSLARYLSRRSSAPPPSANRRSSSALKSPESPESRRRTRYVEL